MDEISSYESVFDAWKAEKHVLTIERAKRHLERFSDDWLILSVLGEASFEIGRLPEAKAALLQALNLAPPEKQYMVHRELGHVCRWSGEITEAEEHYRNVIASRPEDAAGYIYLGAMLSALGRLDAAQEQHRRATECSEGAIDEAYLNLALVLRAKGAYAEAKECLERALALDPDYTEAATALGDLESVLSSSVDV